MKKIKFIILVSISLLLFGCGNDMSKYDVRGGKMAENN